jgi:hypothetical protein
VLGRVDQLGALADERVAALGLGAWIDPGIANTSRPASDASRAVISEPERSAASTTSVPSDRPAMMRLRCGKFSGSGGVPRRTR